jgi:thioredoxin reductase
MGKCNVAIIGAGPYGLSVAAYLKGAGMNFRIFGSPMHTWITQMPQGMHLKSEGMASSLYDPASEFTLEHYCREKGLPYADHGLPVPIEMFIAYGLEFQKRFVPELEDKKVVSLKQSGKGFELALEDGERFSANAVVIAVGISHYAHIPAALSVLPEELLSHSSGHSNLDHFKGREVAVLGAGSSAIDVAALLHEAGAKVQVIARKPKIRFHDPPDSKPQGLFQRLNNPPTGIGPGWKLYFCAYMPWAFRRLPQETRLKAVKKILGPAPGWFIKDRVVGKMPFHMETNVTQAKVQDGRVSLELTHDSGERKTIVVDHVIAATGYQVDLKRLAFLDSGLRSDIGMTAQMPALSAHFESSVPGLYFVGTSAANTFGPLMRFAYGARFAAQQVSSQLAKSVSLAPAGNVSLTKVDSVDRNEVGVR